MKVVLLVMLCLYPFISLAATAEMLVTKLSDEAYLLKSANYNTNTGALKTSRGIVLIDPMPGENNLRVLSKQLNGIYGSQHIYVLNTHQHDDHSGGNSYFVNAGAKLLSSTIDWAEIKTVEVKSHSSADNIFFHRSSNSIFVGDIYDTDWHPTFYAGGVAGFVSAVDAILELGDENSLIIPGHGKPTSKEELKKFRQNTLDWVSEVKALKESGLQLSEIQHNEQIKKIFQRFNVENRAVFVPEKAFIRFIERTLAEIDNAL
ncbi:MBL fold metallo-hydrolase [Rheinheimera soli]|uniref:beta-lactamase n=1 Tax=Rheinheimera soli TaxID=443616 RepID=A0ABU1VV64_9GAMM|nr:MBL fold metallo-hydrolase [Rheinheimera soli]MDR7119602.1 glyoxylase-like metal-dependent hydrolase (beta-lactamase superfamily II) [Rheinheimera soli]